ncbi:KH domain-containing protein [Candidatus Saccharibacteria bacterium]|nr:KH domain-containing protein [Candidatus Saccharibacteria bacterium]
MATIDQQFVEYIVKTLVNNPEKVAIDRTIDEKGVLLSLTVDPEDVGRVIGKRGVTAQAIRVLLRALGTKQDARYNLKIVNTDNESGEAHPEKPETPAKKEEDEPVKEEMLEDDEVEEISEEEPEDEENENEEESSSELAEKTRAELADLDDLDI